MVGCLGGNLLFEALGAWLLATGVVGFIMMGIDKARAVGGEWRISELTLFTVAWAGGTLGVVLGSLAFHHKTKKLSFMAVVYLALITWLIALQQTGSLGCFASALRF